MEIFNNSFFSGLDQDTDPRLLKNSFYLDGFNITLFKDNEFGSISPIGGTSSVYNSIPNTGDILKIYSTKFNTDSGEKDGILIFSSKNNGSDWTITIKSFILDNSFGFSSNLLYSYNVDLEVDFIDCASFKEKNKNVVYFTDRITSLKKIPCDITASTLAELPFNLDQVIVISNDIPNTPITSKSSNGRILAGSYQSSVRFINSKTNQTTKWSLISNPLIIEDQLSRFTSLISTANVGRVTNYSYKILIDYANIDLDSYDYYQVAVVENNLGTGITKLTANLLPPKLISGDNYILYNNDTYEEQVPIEDIVVDDAQLKTCNTLAIKNNRLFLGGLTYRDLSVSDLNVTINNTLTKPILYKVNSSSNRSLKTKYDFGYFRDEVYRYGVVYKDDYGNWSPVKVIDFSSAINNYAAVGCVDFKFPSRKNKDYTIENSSGELEQLALRISEIEGHPEWAKGVALVRAKRKKNIQFQSPLIHTRYLQSSQATLSYPQGGTLANEEAQIGSLGGTILPKDFSDIYPKHYVSNGLTGSVSEIEYESNQLTYNTLTGNSRTIPSAAPSTKYVHVLFNPNNLYNFNGVLYNNYTFSDGDKITPVDVSLLTAYYNVAQSSFSGFIYNPGFDSAINEVQAWAEVPNKKWFYRNHNLSESSIIDFGYMTNNAEIIEYQDVVSGQDKVILLNPPESLSAGTFGDNDGVMSTGLTTESVPSNQAMSVVVTSEAIKDIVYYFNKNKISSNDETIPLKINGSYVENGTTSSIPYGISESNLYNSFVNSGWSRGVNPRTTGAVSIVNVERGLSDFRYGDIDNQYEFILTGNYAQLPGGAANETTKISFDVYGGDCSLDYHTFKISDSSFIPVGYINDRDFSGNKHRVDKYGDRFNLQFLSGGEVKTNSEKEHNRFNPQKGRSQTITVALESEFMASLAQPIEHNKLISLNNIKIKIPNGDGEVRIPFNYNYNIDISLNNNNKVFFPELIAGENNNEFYSRIIYSDQKIYNTRNNGLSKFRVGNIYDLNEGYGVLEKLELVKDNLISFQERSIRYIPIETNIIEQADASQLSVRSSEVIGNDITISNISGCNNINTIASTDEGVYFADFNNKSIYYLSGRELSNISSINNRSFFDYYLVDNNRDFHAVYDRENLEYLLFGSSNSTDGVFYSEKISNWFTKVKPTIGSYPTSRSSYSSSNGIILCFNDSETNIHKANDFNSVLFLNKTFDSSLEFSVNPDVNYSKVFDVFTIVSNNPVSNISIESNLGSTSMDVSLANLREDSYRVPITRGDAGRIRGNHSVVSSVLMNEDNRYNEASSLLNVNTAYRISERKI